MPKSPWHLLGVLGTQNPFGDFGDLQELNPLSIFWESWAPKSPLQLGESWEPKTLLRPFGGPRHPNSLHDSWGSPAPKSLQLLGVLGPKISLASFGSPVPPNPLHNFWGSPAPKFFLEPLGVLGTQIPSAALCPCSRVPQVTVRVKVEDVAPGDVEDPGALGVPPSPPLESPREEAAPGKEKATVAEEEEPREGGTGMGAGDPSSSPKTG